jgi:glycosyltransferase involved in cell wall biosynthesis
VIGYVGRLSVEKNVGLFVLAAHEILKFCPFCRFTIVGDGLLRPYLEELCDRLEISWAVKFTGKKSYVLLKNACNIYVFRLVG